MDFSWVLSKGISIALELRAFVIKYGERLKAKERFLSAISEQALEIDQTWNKLNEFNNSLVELLDSIEDCPSINQVNDFLLLSADAMRIQSAFIDAYVNYSIAVKQFSANEYLMENLKNYKGMLYDYVDRVSETVLDDNTILIGGNFYTFLKAYQKDMIKKEDKKEIEEAMIKIKEFMDKLKVKIIPNIISMKPRTVFRPKRIKIIYLEPYKKLKKDLEKIKIDIPESELIDMVPGLSMPLNYVIDELKAIENKMPTNRRLTHHRKKRKK